MSNWQVISRCERCNNALTCTKLKWPCDDYVPAIDGIYIDEIRYKEGYQGDDYGS
jgi:hypothetical protein